MYNIHMFVVRISIGHLKGTQPKTQLCVLCTINTFMQPASEGPVQRYCGKWTQEWTSPALAKDFWHRTSATFVVSS